jgi:hypothetical protein
MKEHEEFLARIVCFEEAAKDPAVQARLESDAALREAFEAQRRTVQIIQLKRFENQSEESARRIRAGVLRTIRSSGIQSEAKTPAWWGGFKLAASLAVVALIALPFILKPGGDIQPVTSFSASEANSELAGESPAFQIPDDSFLMASNVAPSTQFGPVEIAPVKFDVP